MWNATKSHYYDNFIYSHKTGKDLFGIIINSWVCKTNTGTVKSYPTTPLQLKHTTKSYKYWKIPRPQGSLKQGLGEILELPPKYKWNI